MIANRTDLAWQARAFGMSGPSFGEPPSVGARCLVATLALDLFPLSVRCRGLGHIRSAEPNRHGFRIVMQGDLQGYVPQPPILAWDAGLACRCWRINLQKAEIGTTAARIRGRDFEGFGFLDVRPTHSFLVAFGALAREPNNFWPRVVEIETAGGDRIPVGALTQMARPPVVRVPVESTVARPPRFPGAQMMPPIVRHFVDAAAGEVLDAA